MIADDGLDFRSNSLYEWRLHLPFRGSRPSSEPAASFKFLENDVLPTVTSRTRDLFQKNRGDVLVLASQVLAALMHGTAKYLETGQTGVHPLQILTVRMVITVALSTSYMCYTHVDDFPLGSKTLRPLLILRAIGGTCGAVGFYCECSNCILLSHHGLNTYNCC